MKKAPDTGFLNIIISLVLCAICPFLIIPWLMIYCIGSDAGITEMDVIQVVVLLAIYFIIFVTPIATFLYILMYGIEQTIKDGWICILITLAEIFFCIKYYLIPKIKKYKNNHAKNKKKK